MILRMTLIFPYSFIQFNHPFHSIPRIPLNANNYSANAWSSTRRVKDNKNLSFHICGRVGKEFMSESKIGNNVNIIAEAAVKTRKTNNEWNSRTAPRHSTAKHLSGWIDDCDCLEWGQKVKPFKFINVLIIHFWNHQVDDLFVLSRVARLGKSMSLLPLEFTIVCRTAWSPWRWYLSG